MQRYSTKGVCSSGIEFDVKDNIIREVRFLGGCDGNLKGISSLVIGMTPQEAARRLTGIQCGTKKTSCPDQLSRALAEYIR